MKKKKTLTVTLKRSCIGRPEKQRLVVRGLGLRGINSSVVLPDTPEIRGMVNKIPHLVEVKES
jgi:large subunit ribosomal protein L30